MRSGRMQPKKLVIPIRIAICSLPKVRIRGINVARVIRGALSMADTPEANLFLFNRNAVRCVHALVAYNFYFLRVYRDSQQQYRIFPSASFFTVMSSHSSSPCDSLHIGHLSISLFLIHNPPLPVVLDGLVEGVGSQVAAVHLYRREPLKGVCNLLSAYFHCFVQRPALG